MQYNPALTGLRGVAILPVVAFHCKVPGFSGGFYGVDLFFVLSGFLITSLLRDEVSQTGTIDLGGFYINRLLRLTPPLFLCLAVLIVLDLADPMKTIVAAFYLTDVVAPFAEHPYGPVGHTWSLAVEEHFYLMWPIALIAILKTRRPELWIVMLFVAASIWRLVSMPFLPGEMTYFRLDARLSGLLLGSAVALVSDRIVLGPLAPRLSICILSVAMLGATIYTIAALVLMTLVEIAAAVILVAALRTDTALHRALSHPWIVKIGLWSYALYLWHYPIAYAVRQNNDWPSTLAITLLIGLPIAAATYHLVEVPVSKFRKSQLVSRRSCGGSVKG